MNRVTVSRHRLAKSKNHFARLRKWLPALLLPALLALPNSLQAQAANPPLFGAVIQYRPSATGTTYMDMDFTGLNINFTSRYVADPHYYYDTNYTQQYGGNSYGPGYYWGILIGYDYSLNGGHLDVTGSSTYKARWTVPNGIDAMGLDTGTPDLINFPVPKLFMLGHVYADMTADLYYGGNDVSADGKLLDPWTLLANVPGFNGPVNPMLYVNNKAPVALGRGILTATLDMADPDKTLLQALLSPTPYVNMYGNDLNYECSDGELDLTIYTHGFFLELTDTNQPVPNNGGAKTLELFGHPKARGDGKNQFVYDASGTLYLPAGINVNGAAGDVTSDDTSYLIHAGKVQVGSDISYVQPVQSTYVVPSGAATTIVPQTSLGNGVLYNGLVYPKMPYYNADMGNHQIKLQINLNGWQDSEIVNIQTFFKPDDTSHDAPIGSGVTPNWFWYYRDYDRTPVLYGGALANTLGKTDYVNIKIYNGASLPRTIPVFGIFKDVDGKRRVKKSGTLDINGLYSYLDVVGHELAHIAHYQNNIEVNSGDPNDVGDKDGVADVWEGLNNFDPTKSDTSGEYGGLAGDDAGKGDRECLCDIDALGYLLAAHQRKAWQNDWALGGMQRGILPPSRQGGPNFFPWTYRSYDPATMTFGDPTGTLPTPGSGTLTSLSQLDGKGKFN